MINFHSFKANSIFGDVIDFAGFAGKKVMLVNVASKCGYTPQYEELEALQQEHGDKIQILGFPSNDFGGQEPGSDQEVAEFCRINFGVSFPLFAKIKTLGANAHPIYQWLADTASNGGKAKAPNWNFNKYLIDEKGEVFAHLPSATSPFDHAILNFIGASV